MVGKAGSNRASIQQQFAVKALLDKVLVRAMADEPWSYVEGYTDNRVAKECGDLSVSSVAHVRMSFFGKIRAPKEDQTAVIAALREQIQTLESRQRTLYRVVHRLGSRAEQQALSLAFNDR